MNYLETITTALAEKNLSQTAADNITTWLSGAKYAEYRTELESLIEKKDWKILEDSFFQVIPFGTGGRRGTVGVGSNRINKITIGESAQGLCAYAASQGVEAKQQGIVIAYDTRTTSEEFARYVASICAANGFTTYLFDGYRTTPELSFAVRHLKTAAGIVISASHNPPADNGFKAYWNDGGQVVPPHDAGIMEAVAHVNDIVTVDIEQATQDGKIKYIGAEVDAAYVQAIVDQSVTPSRSLHIAYSPLHGTGTRSVVPALEAAGFTHLSVVEEQSTPDGTFPTIAGHVANPEIPAANDKALSHAQEIDADIAITTDPDADRLGVLVKDSTETYQFLTGNKIAALICYHVLHHLQEQKKLHDNHFVVKTIVTTDFIDAIAANYGVKVYNNILIGFKYVAELIRTQQDQGKEEFLFGGEESHGILKGSYTRDKDAAVAALLIAELASVLKDKGQTLMDQLHDLYRQYGLFHETLENIKYEGANGFQQMSVMMNTLRQSPPTTLAGMPVVSLTDRETGTVLNPATKEVVGNNEGTPGNVLIFSLASDNHSRITIRPSGTEPKIKVYTQLHQPLEKTASPEHITAAQDKADQTAKALTAALLEYTQKN